MFGWSSYREFHLHLEREKTQAQELLRHYSSNAVYSEKLQISGGKEILLHDGEEISVA